VRILITILQLEAGKPRRQHPQNGQGDRYVVQVQKKLSRARVVKGGLNAEHRETGESKLSQARAYRFEDFDILAVNLHPATRRWTEFRFALSTRLTARKDQPSLIAASQLASLDPVGLWTNDFAVCLDWLLKETAGTAIRGTSAVDTS
jgi:hypothetical protein